MEWCFHSLENLDENLGLLAINLGVVLCYVGSFDWFFAMLMGASRV